MRHFATIAGGEPSRLEDLIEAATLQRNGVIAVREIGGTAQWEEPGGVPWSLEWLRLVQPRGLRIDLYVDEAANYAAIGEELWQGIFKGQALPIVPGAAEIPESIEGTTGGGSTGGSSGGGGSSGWTSGGGSSLTPSTTSTLTPSTTSRSGLVAATVVGAIGTATTGALLWRCRKKKACKRRPFVVGALVVSALVTVGGGAVWLLTRKGEA